MADRWHVTIRYNKNKRKEQSVLTKKEKQELGTAKNQNTDFIGKAYNLLSIMRNTALADTVLIWTGRGRNGYRLILNYDGIKISVFGLDIALKILIERE